MSTRNIKTTIIALFFVGALCLPVFSLAASDIQPGGNVRICPVKQFFYTFFNITEEQQQELQQIKDATRDEMTPYIEDMKELGDQMAETLLTESIDTAAAADLIELMIPPKSAMTVIKLNARVESAQVLTSEQRADIQEVLNDVSDFIDYVMAYPRLDELKAKYGDRLIRAMMDRKLEFLNLSEEQKDALLALMKATRESIEPISAELEPLGDQLKEALLAETVDTVAAAGIIDRMIEPKEQIMEIKLNAQIEAALLLTPEQRTIIKEKMEEHQKYHDGFNPGK